MHLFKDNRFAALVMALLLVAGSFLGAGRSLRGMKAQVEEAFYSGVDGDGYGIQADLDERIISAGNLITVARRYLSADEETLASFVVARDALSEAKTVEEKFRANTALSAATGELVSHLQQQPLTEADAGYVKRIPLDMQSRNDTISHNGYNELARRFNEARSDFPANIFSGLLVIQPAQYFR